MSDSFKFDPSVSSEANLDRFFEHLESIDSDLSTLLKDNVDALVPLPDPPGRTSARSAFNKVVADFLDASTKVDKGDE